MKIVFMGTPDFAVPFLEALHARHHVSLVVSQPDKPKGRGMKLTAPPVKEKALEFGLPIAQPVALKSLEFHELIRAQAADLLVVVAYRILPATLFPLAKHGAVNVHGSLLPKYRGAAPIQWAIAHGDTETGVTVFQLDAEIDHGGILAKTATPIGPDETSAHLFERLRILGRDTLLKVLEDMEAGRAHPQPQEHAAASPAPKLKKEDGRMDWTMPAQALHDRVRAFNPYPICYGVTGAGKILRIHRTRPETAPTLHADADPTTTGDVRIGTDRYPYVKAGRDWLKLIEVQWEGKPRVSGPDFVNGLQPAEREGLRFA